MGLFGVETALEEHARVSNYLAADEESKAAMRDEYKRSIRVGLRIGEVASGLIEEPTHSVPENLDARYSCDDFEIIE